DFDVSWPATPYLVKGLKIYTNTDSDLNNWEEIDSVQMHAAPVPDFYSFTLAAGDSATVAIKGGTSSGVSLLNSAGTLLAQSVTGSGYFAQVISDFVAPTSGTYYLQTLGAIVNGFELAVMKNAV